MQGILIGKFKSLNQYLDPSKYSDIKYHVKAIQEGMGILLWLFNKQWKDIVDTAIDACKFNGNKIL